MVDKFVSYKFDKFVHNALDNIGPDHLHLLTEDDKRNIARKDRFIAHNSLESKLVLLSKIGYPFAIVIADRFKPPNPKSVERIIRFFFKAFTFKRKQAAFAMKDNSFFFFGDSDIVRGCTLAANLQYTSAEKYLALSDEMLEYKKTAERLAGYEAAAKNIDTVVMKALKLANGVNQKDFFEAQYKIDFRKYLILCLISRQREMSLQEIRKESGLLIRTEMKELIEQGMVQAKMAVMAANSDDLPEKTYWLTGYGELILLKARNYFLP